MVEALPTPDDRAGIWRLAAVAAVGGLATGVLGAVFRGALALVASAWSEAAARAHQLGPAGVVVPVVVVAACAAVARWIVRLEPTAGGSGIQRVEGVMRGEIDPAPGRVIPAKFIGSLFALGSGLVLGREGPTVQMGAAVGERLAAWTRAADADMRALQAATAGAGLAVAFTAPLGGAMFTFEEVGRRFSFRMVVASLVACSVASGVAAAISGTTIEFRVTPPAPIPLVAMPAVVLLGLALGLVGAGYSVLITRLLDVAGLARRLPVEARAAAVGAVVGLALWWSPDLVGGGDVVTQRILDGGFALWPLAVIIAARFVLGPLSYAAGTPGGLFAPLLVIGAGAGTLFAGCVNVLLPAASLDPVAWSLIGMATLLTVVVRAPFTGLLLVVEMTGTTSQVVPMLLASGASMVAAAAMRSAPIYDTLRARMLAARGAGAVHDSNQIR